MKSSQTKNREMRSLYQPGIALTVGLIVVIALNQVGECLGHLVHQPVLRTGNVELPPCVGPLKHRPSTPHRHVHRSKKKNESASPGGASTTPRRHASHPRRPSHHTPSRAPSSHQSNQVPPCRAPSGPFVMSRPQEAPSIPSFVGSTDGLQVGFYEGKCGNKSVDVEGIIESIVKARFGSDPTILPAILRMQFHDCFIHGCDASILINGNSAEKTAIPNLTIRGFDLMDSIKAAVESECPDVVSCADIIAVSTKVLIKLGGGPDYPVQTGRRDGLVSQAKAVESLPSPFLSVAKTIEAFNAKGFTKEEMVILLGCHTVGVAHCVFVQGRLYPGSINFDPLMNPNLRQQITPTCPPGIFPSNNTIFLDQGPGSSNLVDNSYFSQILQQRGILPIDEELARDPTTQGFVQQLSLNATLFSTKLANAMVKLQALEVLTGNQGQIRKVCSRTN